ncbi:polysaccharide biosynthesis family protein, partial [Salmonella enterica]|nr:polysaccharide biosynthesis family protein [Salmonella enterica]EGN1262190.1 polysaccharide biosynthesis family protein [Salmonella enterica]
MEKRIYINTIANLCGVFWQGAIILLMAPFYLKLLGKEQWGMVAACLSLQGILLLLDAGMSQVMPRDFAQKKQNIKAIYSNYIALYFLIALCAVFFLYFSAEAIAEKWFRLDAFSAKQLELAIKIFAGQFFFQFCNNVNLAYWNGNEEQVKANLSQCIFISLKNITAVILILNVSRQTYIYVLSFFLIAMIEFICNFSFIVSRIGACKPSWGKIKRIIITNYKISLGILLGVFSSQLDRIFMSRFLSIQNFGLYVMTMQFGLALLQLQYPMVKAILPHIAKIGDTTKLGLYKTIAFFCVLMPSCILFFWAKDILWLWSHNIEVVEYGVIIVKILSVAVLINFFYNFIHVKLIVENRGG